MKKSHPNNNIQNKIQYPNSGGEETIQKENIDPNQNQNQIPPSIDNINQSNPQKRNNNIELQKRYILNEDIDHPKPLESDYYDEEKEDIREIFNRNKINKSNQKTKVEKIERLDSGGLSKLFIEDIKNDKDLRHNNLYNSIDFKNYNNKVNNFMKEKEINNIYDYSNRKNLNYSNKKIHNIKTSYYPNTTKNDDKKKNIIYVKTEYESDTKKDENIKNIMNKPVNNIGKNQIQNNNNSLTKINLNMNKNIIVINKRLLTLNNQPIINKRNDQDSFNLLHNNNKKIYEEEIKHISYSQPKNINNEKIYKNFTNTFSKPIQNLKENINNNFNLYPRKISTESSIEKYQKNPSKNLQNNRIQNNLLQNNNKYHLNGNSSNKFEKKDIPFYAKSQKYLNIYKTYTETENRALNKKATNLESTTEKPKTHNMVRDGLFNNVKTTNIFYSKKEMPQKFIKVNRISILDSNKNVNLNSNDVYSSTPIKKKWFREFL